MWERVNAVLRYLFFLVVVRPIVLIVLGLNVRRGQLLPETGPAIVVANHNSHLDTLVLMTLFGMRRLRHLRPVAAADYFLRNRLMAWFSTKIIGIIPLQRKMEGVRADPLAGITQALESDRIVLLFPEGSRGEPEQLEAFKTGVAHLAKRHPEVPIVPVFLHGLGKALPRGKLLLIPFFCDVFVGQSMSWTGKRDEFMAELDRRMGELADEGQFPAWE